MRKRFVCVNEILAPDTKRRMGMAEAAAGFGKDE